MLIISIVRSLITIAPLTALAVGEIMIAPETRGGLDPTFWRNIHIAIVCGPLAVIGIAVLFRNDLPFPKILAWICITIGFYIQYVFHTSHDPSRILVIPISSRTYWLCGFLALVSMPWGTSLPKIKQDKA